MNWSSGKSQQMQTRTAVAVAIPTGIVLNFNRAGMNRWLSRWLFIHADESQKGPKTLCAVAFGGFGRTLIPLWDNQFSEQKSIFWKSNLQTKFLNI